MRKKKEDLPTFTAREIGIALMAFSDMDAADLPDNNEIIAAYYKAKSVVTDREDGKKYVSDFYVTSA